MLTLHSALDQMPHRDLRAVATRLGVRRRSENSKESWIESIARLWQDRAQAAALLAQLSPGARQALQRLAQAGQLPTHLFLAEYGDIRRDPASWRGSQPPWQAPHTVSEELYYCGVLHPVTRGAISHSPWLGIPAELRAYLLDLQPLPPLPEQGPFPHPLLHDVAQLLVYLAEHGQLALRHGRWLPVSHLRRLNQRLLRPDPEPLPSFHQRTQQLCFLFFLASAAELQGEGRLTPQAWPWLASSPTQQLALLWQAWRQAEVSLRQAYAQPAASLPPPWPHLLLERLRHQTTPFSVAQLTAEILGTQAGDSPETQVLSIHTYFAAHFSDISALQALVQQTLATDLTAFALVQPVPSTSSTSVRGDDADAYFVTPTGAWLLGQPRSAPPNLGWQQHAVWEPAAGQKQDEEEKTSDQEGADREGWALRLLATTSPWPQAVLAPYACHQGLYRSEEEPYHVYVLEEATVARAAAQGHGTANLLQALEALALPLTAQRITRLYAWFAKGRSIQLRLLPVLQTSGADEMAQIQQVPGVRRHLGELLSPTTCVIKGPIQQVVQQLQRAGYFPMTNNLASEPPAPTFPLPTDDNPPRGAAGLSPGESKACVPPDPSLWLAGHVYALMGDYLALPAPPSFTELQQWCDRYSPAQQAVLQAQLDDLRARIQGLFDGLVFTPPPNPTDPDLWRDPIAQAISNGQNLQITYFSAGRNLLTRRVVEPFWIEERQGTLYLRAYCHQAGRVLTFRLDRIQEMTPMLQHTTIS